MAAYEKAPLLIFLVFTARNRKPTPQNLNFTLRPLAKQCEAPVKLKFRYEEIALLDDVAKFLRASAASAVALL